MEHLIKRPLLWAVILTILISAVTPVFAENEEHDMIQLELNGQTLAFEAYSITLDGNEIPEIPCVYRNAETHCLLVPFFRLLDVLGVSVSETGENEYSFSFEDRGYVLDTQQCTLRSSDSDMDLFSMRSGPAPALKCAMIDGEFYVSTAASSFLWVNILRLKIPVSDEEKILRVKTYKIAP